MSVAGFIDAPLDIFGGLVTDMPAGDLPLGVSPDCQDVAFMAGSVRTRPGLQAVFSAIGGNPTVNYLKTYITPAQLELMLALDASGVLWQESEAAPGVLAQVASGLPTNAYAKSATLFGREYIALSDGKVRHRDAAAVRRHKFRSRKPGRSRRERNGSGCGRRAHAGDGRVAHRRGAQQQCGHDHHHHAARLSSRTDGARGRQRRSTRALAARF